VADFASVVAAVGGGVGTLVAVIQAARGFWTVRLLEGSGATPLTELQPGLQEVRGTSLAEGAVTAPLSGRPCMYWRLQVEQQRRTRWETVLDRREWVPFWIDDGTGRARVEPADADVVVGAAARVRTGVFAHPSAEWSELVERMGPADAPPVHPFLRWREEYLEAGDVLTVVGAARDAAGGWVIESDGETFVVSDRDEKDVLRHHRRVGRRWTLVSAVAVAILAWGLWGLIG